MVNNALGENFNAPKHTPDNIKNLSEELQNFIANAVNEIQKNPETAKKVQEDFDSMAQNAIEKDPEALIDTIDKDMHTKIESFVNQVKNGEIYAEEWKKQAKEVIIKATQLKLYITEKIQNTPKIDNI